MVPFLIGFKESQTETTYVGGGLKSKQEPLICATSGIHILPDSP